MYEILLLDLDDTILDFHKAEHVALGKTLESFGLEPTQAVRERYSAINRLHWERLERKELTREQVLVGRFDMLFREYGIQVDPTRCARRYEGFLGQGHYFLPGAEAALESLHQKYDLYITSNGTASVQKGRLESANIARFMKGIFISQEIGVNKPDKGFFDRCFERIPNFSAEKTMIVGDSLTSDILGGINAGIATCWVNPGRKPGREDIRADYEIQGLWQLEGLLAEICVKSEK